MWRNEVHPTPLPYARRCHPDGFVLVRSKASGHELIVILEDLFCGHGVNFCPYPTSTRHPLGCLGTYDTTTRSWVGRGL